MADRPVAQATEAHLTMLDEEGFPLPCRVSDVKRTDTGYSFHAPAGAPWVKSGKATLVFDGRATFVSVAQHEGARMTLTVERTLPLLPMVVTHSELWAPTETTRANLMGRLAHELDRRGQRVPVLPHDQPAPTAGTQRRTARVARLGGR